MSAKIMGCGGFLPERVVTNDELTHFIRDTNSEWITNRSGIKQRHIAKLKEQTVDLAYGATAMAIEDSGISADEIDMIIVCTNTSDHAFPSVANQLQGKLGIRQIPSFDMQVACSGFVYGMQLVDSLLHYDRKYSTILLVCVDRMSSLLNFKDRTTGVLFGDGAGAVLCSSKYSISSTQNPVQKNDIKDEMEQNINQYAKSHKNTNKASIPPFVKPSIDNMIPGIIDSAIYSDGRFVNILYTCYESDVENFHSDNVSTDGTNDNTVSFCNNFSERNCYGDNVIKMNGKEVFKKAIESMSDSVATLLKENNVKIDEINHFIPHQANARIISSVVDRLGIDLEKVVVTVDKHANCSAASIPLALNELKKSKRIKRGDLVVFSSFGTGITWGSVLFRY